MVNVEKARTDPAAADPAPTGPAAADPAPTGPAAADPAPTGPAPTDPAPTDPAPTTAGREAWRLIMRLVLEGEARTRMHETCRAVGLPVNLVKALVALDRDTPASMRELAGHFAVDASYCTTLVDSLEAHDIARREPHPTDRRVKTVVLTKHGREVLAQVRRRLGTPPAAIAALDPADQRRLRDLLAKVVEADQTLSRPAD